MHPGVYTETIVLTPTVNLIGTPLSPCWNRVDVVDIVLAASHWADPYDPQC